MNFPVGATLRVEWSNGHGYSVYRIEDHPEFAQHQFILVEEHEHDFVDAPLGTCEHCGADYFDDGERAYHADAVCIGGDTRFTGC